MQPLRLIHCQVCILFRICVIISQFICLGAARGCGWQNLCAFINLGAYYVVAIPSAVLLAFIFHIGGMVDPHLRSFALSPSGKVK